MNLLLEWTRRGKAPLHDGCEYGVLVLLQRIGAVKGSGVDEQNTLSGNV